MNIFSPMKKLALGLLISLTVVACAKRTDTTNMDSTGATNSTTTTVAPDTMHTTTSTTTTTTAQPTTWTDANILAKMGEGDSGEVALAKYMLTKTKNSQVKAFAQMMITDHSKMLKDGQALAQKIGVTPAPPAGDNAAQDLNNRMTKLQSASSPNDIDNAYVNDAVDDHQMDSTNMASWQLAAQNPDLKSAILKAEPIVNKHLNHARMLQDKMMKMASGAMNSAPSSTADTSAGMKHGKSMKGMKNMKGMKM